MALDYERFMLKQAEWRGEMSANVIDIRTDIIEIKTDNKKDHNEMKKDIKDIKNQNLKRDIKTAGIAGGMTIIILVFGYILQNGIG